MPEFEVTLTFVTRIKARTSREAAKKAGNLVDKSIERVSVTTAEVPK